MMKHNFAVSNSSGYMQWINASKVQFMGKKLENEMVGNVEIVTLDSLFLERWYSRPGFLHIDVEGCELQVGTQSSLLLRLRKQVLLMM